MAMVRQDPFLDIKNSCFLSMGGMAMAGAEEAAKRQFVNFSYYKVDPQWRRLPKEERDLGKQEFIRAVEEYVGKVIVVPYTTVGIRGDCDFMLWRISSELELFQSCWQPV
jgi:chlorite dismutase